MAQSRVSKSHAIKYNLLSGPGINPFIRIERLELRETYKPYLFWLKIRRHDRDSKPSDAATIYM